MRVSVTKVTNICTIPLYVPSKISSSVADYGKKFNKTKTSHL
jgi:hypothetical protein